MGNPDYDQAVDKYEKLNAGEINAKTQQSYAG